MTLLKQIPQVPTLRILPRRTAQYLLRTIIGQTKVFVIVGARRSGNHAFVGWLGNALESSDKPLLRDGDLRHVYRSDSGKTIHINEVNALTISKYLQTIRAVLPEIRRCEHLLLSYEDSRLSDIDRSMTVPARVESFFVVRRSTLNLVSSRLRALSNAAAVGYGDKNKNVDERLLSMLIEYHTLAHEKWVSWSFDEWVDDNDRYRSRFLHRCGLSYDQTPHISPMGGGSSFNGLGMAPSLALTERYTEVDFSPEIVSRLLEDRYRPLFSDAEVKYLLDRSHEL